MRPYSENFDASDKADAADGKGDSLAGELFFTLLVVACALLMLLATNLPAARQIKTLRIKRTALQKKCDAVYRENEKLEREINALSGRDPFYIEGAIRKVFDSVQPGEEAEGGE